MRCQKNWISGVWCLFLIQFQLHMVGVFGPMKTSCGGQKQMMPPCYRMLFCLPQDKTIFPVLQMWALILLGKCPPLFSHDAVGFEVGVFPVLGMVAAHHCCRHFRVLDLLKQTSYSSLLGWTDYGFKFGGTDCLNSNWARFQFANSKI
jgi:hypothetical protein